VERIGHIAYRFASVDSSILLPNNQTHCRTHVYAGITDEMARHRARMLKLVVYSL
jgi:hypothetical protein